MPSAFHHIPVLLKECIHALQVRPGGRYIDGTLGGGGHSKAILEASSPDGIVIGIDRDPHAISTASNLLKHFDTRFQALHGCFGNMAQMVKGYFDGILLDLGVSSPQLDNPDRGFSFRQEGPVDMRMNPQQKKTAAQLIDELNEQELANIIYQYGEEPRSRRIARGIIHHRPFANTIELAECIRKASGYRNSRKHPATKTFQALRIALNDELNQLQKGLEAAFQLLADNGRIAIISFHSLEDRIIKRRLRQACGIGTPRDVYGHPVQAPIGRLISPKGIEGKRYDPSNSRARSARLRIFEKFSSQPSPQPSR